MIRVALGISWLLYHKYWGESESSSWAILPAISPIAFEQFPPCFESGWVQFSLFPLEWACLLYDIAVLYWSLR